MQNVSKSVKINWNSQGERNKMVATIDAPGEYEISYEAIQQDYPEFTRIAIRLKNPVKSGIVEIEFKPVI